MESGPEFFNHIFESSARVFLFQADDDIVRKFSAQNKIGTVDCRRVKRSTVGNYAALNRFVKHLAAISWSRLNAAFPLRFLEMKKARISLR